MDGGATAVVREFIEAINRKDLEALEGLMSEDHRFIDALGEEVLGRTAMSHAWASYFGMFPDYEIHVEQLLASESQVVVFGTAEATYGKNRGGTQEDHWSGPAAWRARVQGGRLAEWQVYTDTSAVRTILKRHGSAG